jgi:hypothetical protein
MAPLEQADVADHQEAVESHHRFPAVSYRGSSWELSHLDAFALRVDPGLGFEVDVVVLFSCHCFTRSPAGDGQVEGESFPEDVFDNGRERRVLDTQRYELSRKLLPGLITELPTRTIRVARATPQNYVTLEAVDVSGAAVEYGVFFEVTKDARRKRRLLLHVQSAYALDTVNKRLRNAGKVSFEVLLRAAYEGRKIRG